MLGRMSLGPQIRLFITRQLCESIDGIQLSSFRPGYVYQVGPTIGNYLLAVEAAEPADDDNPYTSSFHRKSSCSFQARPQHHGFRKATRLFVKMSARSPQIGHPVAGSVRGVCACG